MRHWFSVDTREPGERRAASAQSHELFNANLLPRAGCFLGRKQGPVEPLISP